ncbi:helix-turn-helix domain-containing protein [Pseudomonas sp. N040]|uniref:helix-turn-helix domain-containing protein n=1 Tax=Pseudomonas sp. N040 TaxID=2785325 RepID=UPI0018A33A3B|nr:AraC family transcriptional regulator [Pseudomonas sp. N040]MBF7730943.1 helix-turn-helix transcriptional regulator [Pseudomonas sp. N040]MBW7014586.1 AraC family transcriptional regulator [Pseudomonas sp. N040]
MPVAPEQIADLLLRGAGLGLLALLGLRLLQPPRHTSRLLCLGLVLCIGGYLLTSGGFDAGMPLPLRVPLVMLATLAPALFWLFGQALFDDELRWHWLHALPVLALGSMPLVWLGMPHNAANRQLLDLFQHLFAGLLVGHVLWLIGRNHGSDLLLPRRHLRLWLGPGIGLYILTVLLVELLELGQPQGYLPVWLDLLNLLGICLGALWLSLRLEALLELLAPPAARPHPTAAADSGGVPGPDQPALQRLQQAMQVEQLWRRESLSVGDLASHLGLAEYRLRRLINGALGQRNFNTYLNQFRIEAACAQLSDPARRRLPVLSIALDVGFASIGPFNRAFKAQLGVTPSEFRREKLGEN